MGSRGEAPLRILLFLAVGAVLLSGCTSPEAPPDAVAPTTQDPSVPPAPSVGANATAPGVNATAPPPPRPPVTTTDAFGYVAGVNTPAGPWVTVAGPNAISFDVPEGAVSVLAEARFACSSPTCDMALEVLDPEDALAASGTGSGTITATVAGPAAGGWVLRIRPNSPAVANIQGDLAATVFFGPMPTGFTAFQDANATAPRA